jgi:hypothetical protein
MGVSGEAHTHAVQPAGHVPCAVGIVQTGYWSATGPYTSQQSWSALQQLLPQQCEPAGQVLPVHAGVPQVPSWQ